MKKRSILLSFILALAVFVGARCDTEFKSATQSSSVLDNGGSGFAMMSLSTVAGFTDNSFALDNFTLNYDIVPGQNKQDLVIGLSQNAAGTYNDLAAIVRFNPDGFIDVRNGAAYGALTSLAYSSGVSYHIRMVVNVPAHKYSAFVTPKGSAEIQLAVDYAFRTEQASVTSLGNLGMFGNPGTAMVTNISISIPLPNMGSPAPAPTPGPVPAPAPAPAPSPNLIANGSFESGVASWYLNRNNGTATIGADNTTSYSGSYSGKLSVTQSLSNIWDLAIYQPNLALTGGQQYTVSFYAKAGANRDLIAAVGQAYSPFTRSATQTFSLTTTWQKFSFTFTQPSTDSNMQLMLVSGQATGTVYFDLVSIVAGASSPSPAPAPAPAPSPLPWSVPVPDITGFSGSNGSTLTLDGHQYFVDSANKSYSVTSPDSQTLRFEIRSGDCFTRGNYSDCPHSNRAEVEAVDQWPNTADVHVQYEFMLEPGAANTATWMVIGQLWSVGGSPPFAVEMQGEHMSIDVRWTADKSEHHIWTDPNPIQRGRYYKMDISVNYSRGTAVVYRDGVRILNYSGALGYGGTSHWEFGLYRAAASETQVARYRNMIISP